MPCVKRAATKFPPVAQHDWLLDDDDDDDYDGPSCRLCFETSKDSSCFISPCECKGTQRYVHFKCLRRWQSMIALNNPSDVRAYRCGVCCTTYTTPPPKANAGLQLVNALRGVGGAICISLLAFGMSGPPWPHLALLVLVLLGTRSTSLLALALLLVGSLVATLHTRGLRLVMRVDGQGRMGLALIRHGAPVEGLHAGSLLVASEALDRGVFRRSVVLITEHSVHSGAKGVVLTQPLPHADLLGVQAPEGATIRHNLGGPVGMPTGTGAPASELEILHTVPGITGASKLLAGLPADGQGHTVQNGELYCGGSLTEVADRVLASAAGMGGGPAGAVAGMRRLAAMGGIGGGYVSTMGRAFHRADRGEVGGGVLHRMWVYHGICAWAPGQLEGEVRSGAWGYGKASLSDVIQVPPEQLWFRLFHDTQRLQWWGNNRNDSVIQRAA